MKINVVQNEMTLDDGGVKVVIDLSQVNTTPDQRRILDSMSAGGTLSQQDRDAVKDLKAYIGGGAGPTAGIVRFDWKWFSID